MFEDFLEFFIVSKRPDKMRPEKSPPELKIGNVGQELNEEGAGINSASGRCWAFHFLPFGGKESVDDILLKLAVG